MINIMPQLPYTTNGFELPVPAREGVLDVSFPQLVWAALTVGASSIVAGGQPRPLVELCWRAALMEANLEHQWYDGEIRWTKTTAYAQLDPSEKSAVSYFLGMAQAKLTSERLLGVPHLVHLDALLTHSGYRPQVLAPTS